MTQTETAPPETTVEVPTDTDSAEAELTNEIGKLWQVHAEAQTSVRKSRDELKLIRTSLSQRLHELKAVLSRPGRGGAWSSFLVAQKIPRSTGDRLVRAHEKTLNRDGENCATEQISEPIEVMVRRYLQGLWPRLSRVLTTREAVELFIAELRHTAEKSLGVDTQAPGS